MGVNQIMGGGMRDANTVCDERGATAQSLGQHQDKKQEQEPKQASENGTGPRAYWRSSPFFEGTITTVVLMTALLCRMGDYLQVRGFVFIAWLSYLFLCCHPKWFL